MKRKIEKKEHKNELKHYGNETPTRENKICNLTISSIFFPFSICTDIGVNGFDFLDYFFAHSSHHKLAIS